MTTVDITENFSLTQIGVKHNQIEVHDNTRAFGYDSVMDIVWNVGSKTMSCGTISSSFSSFVSHFWFLPFSFNIYAISDEYIWYTCDDNGIYYSIICITNIIIAVNMITVARDWVFS